MRSAEVALWMTKVVALAVATTQLAQGTPAGGQWRRRRRDAHEGGGAQEDPRQMALAYLRQFGYLHTDIPSPVELRAAVDAFQEMAGLPRSGHLDAQTVQQMRAPRCGNGDVARGMGERRRRFVYISRWEDKVRDGQLRLKWFLHNYTPDMSREQIRSIVVKAFNLWSSQVAINVMESLSLEFEEAPSEAEADITILWAVGDHGDAHKFDGPGEDGSNILAHTFYPNYQHKGTLNGDIHLDDYEQWNVDGSKEGASFPHVLVHEIGHTLGLGHSKKQQAIMFPIYRKEQLDLMQLDLDDKCAINWSYVGASDLCLYIWLLSEVLPKKVAPEKELSSNMLDDGSETQWEDMDALRRRLNGLAMPKCEPESAGGKMRFLLAELLRRRLSFPRQMAKRYAGVLCDFFAAFRREFDLEATSNFHEVFRMRGAHNYFQPDANSFAALEGAQPRHTFDSVFFRQLMAAFLGGEAKQLGPARRR